MSQVDGQSFMIHQIRKMVGLVTYIMRFNKDPKATFALAFSHQKLAVPIAPSIGLLLDRVLYDSYNEKNGHLQPLDLASSEEALAKFKESCVMVEVEKREREEGQTIRYHPSHCIEEASASHHPPLPPQLDEGVGDAHRVLAGTFI